MIGSKLVVAEDKIKSYTKDCNGKYSKIPQCSTGYPNDKICIIRDGNPKVKCDYLTSDPVNLIHFCNYRKKE